MNAPRPALRLLFVDDDARVLDGLRRSLRPLARECEMRFVLGGEKALEALAQQEADVVVSDMRMPGMGGAMLLALVRERFPHTIRLALSGQAGQQEILDSVGPVQQFLMKPCEAMSLRATIHRLLALRDTLKDHNLRGIAGRVETLTPAPQVLQQLIDALQDPDIGLDTVGDIVARDPAMTAKCIQLVNSAFFGVPRPARTANEAVSRLGLANLRSLAFVARVFEGLGPSAVPGFTPESIWRRGSDVASRARLAAQALGLDADAQNIAYTAGMLTEVGRFALVVDNPDRSRAWLSAARAESLTLSSVERKAIGANQAQIGGYLLGVWGFSDACVNAVAYHEQPASLGSNTPDLITALHLARAIAPSDSPADRVWRVDIDESYLAAVGATQTAARFLAPPGAAA